MDRQEGFPPRVTGFVKRKREKEELDDTRPPKAVLLSDESGRAQYLTVQSNQHSRKPRGAAARTKTRRAV